ncbi:MAG: hypothetical protein CFH10_00097 [Alphaproteobacteria bacterium MarineAlpha4_Bin2]|nr:MAG: hypothetical protein CFH10_00097 [Alphaproteobacteria bacterium MarineAlpha4_Bin2]
MYVLGSNGLGGYRTYVGWTTDLGARLIAHNSGVGARSTRGRTWELLYAEKYNNRSLAMSREWHLKRDRKFRRRLVAKD